MKLCWHGLHPRQEIQGLVCRKATKAGNERWDEEEMRSRLPKEEEGRSTFPLQHEEHVQYTVGTFLDLLSLI